MVPNCFTLNAEIVQGASLFCAAECSQSGSARATGRDFLVLFDQAKRTLLSCKCASNRHRTGLKPRVFLLASLSVG
jgi:hypothetical protein